MRPFLAALFILFMSPLWLVGAITAVICGGLIGGFMDGKSLVHWLTTGERP